jgi:hypothetical protein
MAPSAVSEPEVAGLANDVPPANGIAKPTFSHVEVAAASEFQYPPEVPNGAAYDILGQYHSKPTKLRVACIGAGASGLCRAYKMQKMMVPESWELTLFEKNPEFGGTWYENTYPGVACDVRTRSRS